MLEHRIQDLRHFLSSNELDAFLIIKPSSLRYLLGFTGSNGLGIITNSAVYFITDFRYKDQAEKEVQYDKIILADGSLINSIKEITEFNRFNTFGFESDYITYNSYQNLSEVITSNPGSSLLPFAGTLDKIASKKSPGEILSIRKACDITLKVFDEIKPYFRENVTESDIAAEISYKIKKKGGEGDSFNPIVLFGKNTALPHGVPGKTKLRKGENIQLDFGSVIEGYHADFSRCLYFGNPPDDFLRIHNAVRNALETAIAGIEVGKGGKEIDAFARNVIKEFGYGDYFGHAVGHGVGLSIHEMPKISPLSEDELAIGNVFTVEPGIYISDKYGVRIENVVSIERSGVNVLTDISTELSILY